METGAGSNADTGSGENFAKGADCYCPVDCEENLYIPEMSQADIRPDAKALSVSRDDKKKVANCYNNVLLQKKLNLDQDIPEINKKVSPELELKHGTRNIKKGCFFDRSNSLRTRLKS